jgi:hypothetical protein
MITELDQVTEFPLCWPPDKPRSSQRAPSPFRTTMARAQEEIRWELPRWRARRWVISMAPQYRQGAIDPGVAIWWEHPVLSADGRRYDYDLRVLACDNYLLREANLHAIALTFERLRSLERYGTYSMDQAIEGARLALPPPAGREVAVDWKKLLGYISPPIPKAQQLVLCKHAFRSMSREVAGDETKQRELNLAIEAARAELSDAPAD